jgi:hypothetical protein
LGTFLTRQVPGIAAGIIPYIAVNNLWYRKSGQRQLSYNASQIERGIKKIDGFGAAFWKERPYQAFWMFSLGRDLYFDAYDKLFGMPKSAITTASRARNDAYGDLASLDVAPASNTEHIPSSQVSDVTEHHKALGHANAAAPLAL